MFDNLRAAVSTVLVGAERKLAQRFEALAAHYVWGPSFARPRTGQEEGSVEGRGQGIRWEHLVPIPAGASLATRDVDLVARLDHRATEHRDHEGRSIRPVRSRAWPDAAASGTAFRPHAVVLARASRRSLVKVEGAVYSVRAT